MKAQVRPRFTSSPSTPSRRPKEWPLVIRNGDAVVKIYHTPSVVRGEKYDAYTLSYFASGQRQRRQYSDLAKAREEASNVAAQKSQGALGVAALSAASRVALEEAMTLLARNEGSGNASFTRLLEIVRDYSAARVALPAGATLAEAVQFFATRHPANMPRRTVAETCAEFIEDRRSAGCSAIHLRDLDTCLGQFSRAFQLNIAAVNARLVQQFIYGLKREHDGQPVSTRTKMNMLRIVVSLFNFARRMKYIPPDLLLEISDVPAPRKEHSPIGIYSPAEIRAFLSAADFDVQPALAIGAFAGLRLAEIARLDWREVRLAERLIVVEAGKAKTAARRLVPISDNLAAWLAPHVKPFGPVNPCLEKSGDVGNSLGDRFERAAARARVSWKRNGLRHSYISYRVALLKDVPAVALEAGNSPAVIFTSYRALASEAEGKDWFSILPTKTAENTIPMPVANI